MTATTWMAQLYALLALAGGSPSDCTLSGTAAWSRELVYVLDGCIAVVEAPGGKRGLRFEPDGAAWLVVDGGARLPLAKQAIVPPALVSWSPTSDAFFVDDGEGSGMWSTFRVFRIDRLGPAEVPGIGRAIVGWYRSSRKCPSSKADPSVWGLGWSRDGKRITVLVVPSVGDSCGAPDREVGLVVRMRDGKILEQLSPGEMNVRWRTVLPPDYRRRSR